MKCNFAYRDSSTTHNKKHQCSPMKTLVTFLGRVPKNDGSYRKTRYLFDDGSHAEELAFFGWALQQRVQPDRLVVFGTRGSMWDHLFEGDLQLGDAAEASRLELVEAVEHKKVEQAMLNALAPVLTDKLGCEVVLRLLPYGLAENDQVELLRRMADVVPENSTLHLDVTHAFRHLPMIGLMAALYLRELRQVTVEKIWYGAYDEDTGEAPVYDLNGLLKIADWLNALAIYEHNGDYSVFDRLLPTSIDHTLEQASFLESVNRIGQARSCLKPVIKQLENAFDDPALSLFSNELTQRIDWANKNNYYLRQRDLAFEYLKRGQYLQAILKGWEAFTTLLQREAGGNLDPDNHKHREQVRDAFDSEERKKRPRKRWDTFDELRRLRNAVAHGSQPKGEAVQRALSSADEMHKLLTNLFATLLPEKS